MKRKYNQEYDVALPITFGDDHVALDIPDDGVKTDSGWEIVPVHEAIVSQYKVLSWKMQAHITQKVF